MPRLRRVPLNPAVAASARRRRQCVIFAIIGVILLRTMGTEYSFLQEMNASIVSGNQIEEQEAVQSQYQNEGQDSYQSGSSSEDNEDEADQPNNLDHVNSINDPVSRCSDLSKNDRIFDSCIRESSKYTCQSTTNSSDTDPSWTTARDCNSYYERTNPPLNGALREILPNVLKDLDIKSMIRYEDVDDGITNGWKMFPFWVQYYTIGASNEEMAKKDACLGNGQVHFRGVDLTCSIPPPVDLIWVGDLSLTPSITRSAILYHIQESGIKYLMTARLDETWFDNEQTISISAPLYMSSEQHLGVWKTPFVEEPQEVAWEQEGGTDDDGAQDNEDESESEPEEESDNEAKSDDE